MAGQLSPYLQAYNDSITRALQIKSNPALANAYVNTNINSGAIAAPNTQAGSYQMPYNTAASIYGLPSSGGQPSGGGSSGGGGVATTPVNTSNGSDPNAATNYLNILRGQYDLAAQGLHNQDSAADQTYDLAKGDINSSIDEGTKAADLQKQDVVSQFGQILKQQLKGFTDSKQTNQGLFSNLGTLDSSAYEEMQNKNEQTFKDQSFTTDTERTKATTQIDNTLTSFVNKAKSQLGQLSIQYQSGKQAIQQALAQNNLNEASGIQQALDTIKARAQQVSDQMNQWATQAALLKTQGVDVAGALKGINGDGYASNVANQLGSAQAFGQSLINSLLPKSPTGAGFIGSGGTEDENLKKLLAGINGGAVT